MGNTPYRIRRLFFEPEDFSFFIPGSAIAASKRLALALLEEKTQQEMQIGRKKGAQGLSGEDPLDVLKKAYPGKTFITAATPLSEDTPLMTSRYCLKQVMGNCPRQRGTAAGKWSEPLYLVRGKKKFPLYFDCQECVMLVGNAVSSKRESPQARQK